jgi:hypothetical protein
MSRKHWPESWGSDFEALLSFRNVRAIADGDMVILMGDDNVAFALVPKAIELRALQATLPILRESFEMGVQAGRDALASQLRGLIGFKSDNGRFPTQ